MVDARGLSLDQAPPIHLPLRFFLTAPWLAVAAGVILAMLGAEASASRWTPGALAVTHLIALGFLAQVMCGALLQMLPVIAGAPVPRAGLVAPVTHAALTGGSVLLAAGFLGGGAVLLGPGAAAAGLGLAVYLGALTPALIRAKGATATRMALRLAGIALALTVLLGVVATTILLGWWGLPGLAGWVQAHLSWGLFGWVGLTIVGIAYQVVPLFHVTPAYPVWLTRWLAPLLFLTLAAGTLLILIGRAGPVEGLYSALALGFATFAVATLWLQRRRSRPRVEATLIHWWMAMGALLGSALAWWLRAPAELLGVLLLVGVGVGLPSGMLLKILPFLCWFHLQSRQVVLGRFDVRVPHMHHMLPDRLSRWHPPLHGLALVLLAAGTLEPTLTRIGGAALAVSALWLFGLLASAAWRYRLVSLALGRKEA